MKIKITLLPVAFNNKFNSFDSKRNTLLTDGNKPISRYMYSESVEECLKKLCEKYLFYSDSWLDIALVDFRKVSDSECEAVYFTQFPYVDGFHRAGTPNNLASEEILEKLGEYYIGILSTHTTRRFAP
tara:strand:- start:392 stop:775 length:384 start_codon:yes stop_codon:yes gene_type:complete